MNNKTREFNYEKQKWELLKILAKSNSNKYMDITNIFVGHSHERSIQIQNLYRDLEDDNLIETRGGEHLEPINDNGEVIGNVIYLGPIKARITQKGITSLNSHKTRFLRYAPVAIIILSFIGLLLSYYIK